MKFRKKNPTPTKGRRVKKFQVILNEKYDHNPLFTTTLNNLQELESLRRSIYRDDYLRFFSSYIFYTNPDYKYNESYLTGKITRFKSDVEKLIELVKIRDYIFYSLKRKNIPDKCHIEIAINELWVIKYNLKTENKPSWSTYISDNKPIKTACTEVAYIKYIFSDTSNQFTNTCTDCFTSKNIGEIEKLIMEALESFLKEC